MKISITRIYKNWICIYIALTIVTTKYIGISHRWGRVVHVIDFSRIPPQNTVGNNRGGQDIIVNSAGSKFIRLVEEESTIDDLGI
ncbi:MAG: hypothetical protein ONA90_04645 [candidate division KSB1 bacterium]|nr:hypothetical protein [candidate division KSB1 bacterium]